MKTFIRILALVAATAAVHAQQRIVYQHSGTKEILDSIVVPATREIEVKSGASLTLRAGAVFTLPDATFGIEKVAGLSAALAAKAPTNNPIFTGTVSGITASMVGLGNANNTSDVNKPVSTAQAAADAAVLAAAEADATSKANAAQATAISTAAADATTKANAAQSAAVQRGNHTGTQTASTISDFAPAAAAAAPVQSVAGKAGAVSLVKADVGLANVDNTSDVNKPVSTAQAAADSAVLAAAQADATTKANAAQSAASDRSNHTGTQAIGTVVGLQPALDAKAPTANPIFSGTVSLPAVTLSGAITAAPTTITTSIDVTKPLNSVTISNSSTTLTYSATPAAGTRTELTITNSAAAVHTVAIPSTWSEQRSANITSLSVPANGSLTVGLRREASRWVVIGDPVGINDLETVSSVDPATTYFEAATPNGSRRILASNMPSVNLPAQVNSGEIDAGTQTAIRSFSPADVRAMVLDHAPAGGGGGQWETGDLRTIPAAFSVPPGWSLPGVNGIPAYTSPDVDWKEIVKLGGTVSDPVFSVPGGEVESGTIVEIPLGSGESARWTDNGSTPTRSSGNAYMTGITLTAPVTLRAIKYRDFWADSQVVAETYTIAAGITNLVAERFEGTGTPSASWTTGNASINYDYTTSPAPLVGTQSLALTGSFTGATVEFGSTVNEVWGFFVFNPSASSNSDIFQLKNSANVAQMTISARVDRLRVQHAGGNAADITGAVHGQTNVIWWRYVAQSGGGGNGIITVYINKNSTSTTRPSASFTFTTSTGGAVSKATFIAQGAGQWIYDDVMFRETEIGSNPF